MSNRPLFEKRHYRAIAAAVHAGLSRISLPEAREVVAGSIAAYLRGSNPSFLEDRFIAACLDGHDIHVGPLPGSPGANPEAVRRRLDIPF